MLRIDLQGGFADDTVEILVDGEPVWREDAVTTNLSVDLAASVPLEAPDGHVDVRIVLPKKGLEAEVDAIAAGETYVAARVEDGRLVVEQFAEAPYYL